MTETVHLRVSVVGNIGFVTEDSPSIYIVLHWSYRQMLGPVFGLGVLQPHIWGNHFFLKTSPNMDEIIFITLKCQLHRYRTCTLCGETDSVGEGEAGAVQALISVPRGPSPRSIKMKSSKTLTMMLPPLDKAPWMPDISKIPFPQC